MVVFRDICISKFNVIAYIVGGISGFRLIDQIISLFPNTIALEYLICKSLPY